MKKKYIITAIIISSVIICFLGGRAYFRPEPIVKNTDTFLLASVFYNNVDVTEKVSCNEIKKILMQYDCVKTLMPMTSGSSDVIIEINGNNERKALHINLGEKQFLCYEHVGAITRKILNGEKMLNELETLISNS
jgi:hypothetical protein